MTYLTEHLPFDSSSNQALPPANSHLLISDTLQSPGYFALYHLISAAILDKRKIIWVEFKGEGRTNLEIALKKMGTNLPLANSKLFTTISPSSLPTPHNGTPSLYDEGSHPTLRPTWDTIAKETSDDQPVLIIMDGLVELTYLGFEPKEIVQFVRAICSLMRKPCVDDTRRSSSPSRFFTNYDIRTGGGAPTSDAQNIEWMVEDIWTIVRKEWQRFRRDFISCPSTARGW